jgi:hypothetical protein
VSAPAIDIADAPQVEQVLAPVASLYVPASQAIQLVKLVPPVVSK